MPPVAVLTAWVWLGEMPTTVELIGGLIVITGVVIVARGKALRERWHQRSRGEQAQLELVDAASRSWSFERSSSGG